MIMVGLPYLTTEVLNLPAALSNRLYGYAQGALTVGGISGGLSAGIFAKKLTIQKSGNLVMACASLFFLSSPMANSFLWPYFPPCLAYRC